VTYNVYDYIAKHASIHRNWVWWTRENYYNIFIRIIKPLHINGRNTHFYFNSSHCDRMILRLISSFYVWLGDCPLTPFPRSCLECICYTLYTLARSSKQATRRCPVNIWTYFTFSIFLFVPTIQIYQVMIIVQSIYMLILVITII